MESLPFDILNKELIYYLQPKDRGNLGIINKYNNKNRIEWKKNFRISSPDKMVYYRLKFKIHCSNLEVVIPDKYKAKTDKEFQNLPMIKKLNRERFINVTEDTFYIFSILHLMFIVAFHFLEYSINILVGIQVIFVIIYYFLNELSKPLPNLTKQDLIHAYIARDYFYCRKDNYWKLIGSRLNKGNWFRTMVNRQDPDFEVKYNKIKRSKDLYKFYDLFTQSQLELLGF